MAIEVDDSDWSVSLVDTAQQRQCNSVVTSKRNYTWEGLACTRWAHTVGIGIGLAHQQAVMALLNLLDGPGIVVSVTCQFPQSPTTLSTHRFNLRSNWDITTVQNLQLIAERVCLQRHIVTTAESQFA